MFREKVTLPDWVLPVIIIVFATAVFFNKVFYGFPGLDDDFFITKNYDIRFFDGESLKNFFSKQYAGHYHPLTMLLYAAAYSFGKLFPFYYHLFGLVLHLLNIVLVFYTVLLLTGRRNISAITSLLFAIHPLQTEAFMWTGALSTPLYSSFFLLSIILFINYLNNNKPFFLVLTTMAGLFSYLSKSQAISLPLVLILVYIYMYKKMTVNITLKVLPLFLMSLVFLVIAVFAGKEFGSIGENPHIAQYSFPDRILIVLYTYIYYIAKTILPVYLTPLHFIPVKTAGYLPVTFYIAPFLLACIAIFVVFSKKTRRDLLFGLLFYSIVIFITLPFFILGNTYALERYAYLPMTGIFFILSVLTVRICEMSFFTKHAVKAVFILIFVSGIVTLIFLSWERKKIWKDGEILFSSLIELTPDNHYPWYGKGCKLFINGKDDEAIICLKESLKRNPGFVESYGKLSEIYYRKKEYEKAYNYADTAISINRNFVKAYYQRGKALVRLKDYFNASKDLTVAIQFAPGGAKYYERARLYSVLGNYSNAISDFENAIRQKYKFFYVYYDYANLLKKLGFHEEAINKYDLSIRANPFFIHSYNNRGIEKYVLSDYSGAISDYSIALRFNPRFAEAYHNRAAVYASLKDFRNACSDWKKAMGLKYEPSERMYNKYCVQ
ncbi:MAG: tetratricopeptide repeat protein [Bacteroidetes bacterium]|nr:tetratricopeptide repeat protein [Bacteroidota bacterium]